MKIGIWDKDENRFVDENDGWSLYIWHDGKVYEVDAASSSGDSWLDRRDFSQRYEARLKA
ncbi:hypothetical protein [Paenibacillus sp. 32352]|uniref:hypothetical protein n=1 Tax=Paenibacillus sp. 32352 TaxID=1969111 RepID=UPI00117C5207|nr:hypothetical protein [Paenibacillus sp. 32352]